MINLAQRDIRHTLGKFLVTAFGVGMLLGIVLTGIGVYRGLVVESQSYLQDTNADLWVVQESTMGPFAESSRIHEDIKHQIRMLPGIIDTSAIAFHYMQLADGNHSVRAMVVGFELGKSGGPTRLIEGRSIVQSHYEIVVDIKSGFKLNDTILLGGDDYRVVGITKGAVSSGGDPLAYVTLKDEQKLQFLYTNAQIRNDRARGIINRDAHLVNAVIASVRPGEDLEEIKNYIIRWKHMNVFSDKEQRAIMSKNIVERSAKQIGMFIGILILVSSVIISLIIYTMTLGKIKEISILKLIGIPNMTIVKMIIIESLSLGLLAFILGNIFARSMYDKFPKLVVLLVPDALILMGVVIIVSIFGSLSGVYVAIKANPTAAIGG